MAAFQNTSLQEIYRKWRFSLEFHNEEHTKNHQKAFILIYVLGVLLNYY